MVSPLPRVRVGRGLRVQRASECAEHSDEGHTSVLDFDGVVACGAELLHCAAYKLPVQHNVTGAVAYDDARKIAVVGCDGEQTSRNRGTEIGWLGRIGTFFTRTVQRIVTGQKACNFHKFDFHFVI